MKTPISAIEKVIAERANSTEENINIRLFWAYKHSLEAGNDLINFYDVIWERDIEGTVPIAAINCIMVQPIITNESKRFSFVHRSAEIQVPAQLTISVRK